MANIHVKNALGQDVYLAAMGAGTDNDPHVPEQVVTESNSGDILTQLQAVVSALGGTLTVDAGTVTVTGGLTDAQLRASAILTLMSELPDTAAGDLAAIAAALEGTLTVDAGTLTLSALPAGTNNIGDVDVATVTLPGALYSGQTSVTTAGTAVALASTQALVSGVTIKALAANTGIIYVGPSTVDSATGFELAVGEQIFLEIANLSSVYIDAAVNGDGVSWVAS